MKENNVVSASAKYACSGCGACVAVCPKKAIQLRLDDAGFYSACVDDELCVNCGLCKQVCTWYQERIEGVNLQDAPLYAMQSSNGETVKRCSSGGIAHELSEMLIREGWKILGAVYNRETDRCEHTIADSIEELAAFDGSKYIQSNPQLAFRQAVDEAKQDKNARFAVFGTPCQIAGLANVTGQNHIRDQFLLVEIFCHGVPSYKLWDEQCFRIRKKLKAERFDDVQFRYKKNDWHSYCLKVDAGGKTFYGSRENTLFYQVFFENVLLGDSCYNCRLRQEVSMADIRLGDYWGSAFQHRSDGVSAVFACTPRGEEAVARLGDKVCRLEATDAATMLAAQNVKGYHQQALHDKAMAVLREQGIIPAVKTYRAGQTGKQKLKRALLNISAMIPDGLRARLRKANSSRQLKNTQSRK